MAWDRSPDIKGLAREKRELPGDRRVHNSGDENAFGNLEFRVDYSRVKA